MSKFIVKIEHVPSKFTEVEMSGSLMWGELSRGGFHLPIGLLDNVYYFTLPEDWASLLSNLTFSSSLYKKEKFDCDNLAFKAMSLCHERYGLNAFGVVIGDTPFGRHAWNLFYDGQKFVYFDSNEGFGYGGAFSIGEKGYAGEMVII